jgi:hypothetical protein
MTTIKHLYKYNLVQKRIGTVSLIVRTPHPYCPFLTEPERGGLPHIKLVLQDLLCSYGSNMSLVLGFVKPVSLYSPPHDAPRDAPHHVPRHVPRHLSSCCSAAQPSDHKENFQPRQLATCFL